MDVIDNINKRLYDDMVQVLHKGSRLSFAAAYFSIYAFEKLKKELADIDELRFIFTEPSFLTQKENKEKREFYIPRLNRERSLYGTEFEIQLRNKLGQKAIARECAEWLRKKAQFKSNAKNLQVQNFMLVDDTAYACDCARELVYRKGFARSRARWELEKKGIDRETAEYALDELHADWEEILGDVVERKYSRQLTDEAGKRRAINALMRLGYRYEEIRPVLLRWAPMDDE